MTPFTPPPDWTESVERRRWKAEAEETETPLDPFTAAMLEAFNDPEAWAEIRREASAQVGNQFRLPMDAEKSSDPMDDAA